MSISSEIKKNVKHLHKTELKEEQHIEDEKTMRKAFCYIISLLWILLIVLVRRHEFMSAGLVFLYEGILIGIVICVLHNPASQYRKFLGPWGFIVPLGTGMTFRIRYEFYESPDTILGVGKESLIVYSVALIIAILCTVAISRVIVAIKPDIVLEAILVVLITVSLIGQILLVNAILPDQTEETQQYIVVEKYDDNRVVTTYHLGLEIDSEHVCTATIDKTYYDMVKAGDTFDIPVVKGGLGITYLRERSEAVEKQLEQRTNEN